MSAIIRPRRRGPYSRAFKAQIIQCRQGGVSVEAAPGSPNGAAAPPAFVSFDPIAADPGASIRMELNHGPAAVTIHWLVQAVANFGVWQ